MTTLYTLTREQIPDLNEDLLLVVDALDLIDESATLTNVQKALQSLTDEESSANEVLIKLNRLERMGIVEKRDTLSLEKSRTSSQNDPRLLDPRLLSHRMDIAATEGLRPTFTPQEGTEHFFLEE